MLATDGTDTHSIDTPLDDSVLYLYENDGNGSPKSSHVARNDDGSGLPSDYNEYSSRIVFTATYTGLYFARMTPYDDGAAGSFDFIFDITCLLSQAYCDDDGGTFGECSTVPGLTTRLKCITAEDGYSVDAEGTVKIDRTIVCDRGGKDLYRADDYDFCTAFVRDRLR